MSAIVGPSPYVTIGTQTWTRFNLNVDRFRNGDIIPQYTGTDGGFLNLTTPVWCWYNDNPALGAIYGKLYNWFAVNDSRGLAPVGHHIPSKTECQTLIDYLGTNGGTQLKSATLFDGTNSSGFTALPGGGRWYGGYYYALGEVGIHWTTTPWDGVYPDPATWRYAMNVNLGATEIGLGPLVQTGAFSVRCIKD